MNQQEHRLPNRFSFKLTVSIIMIFLCPIAGIVALIFTILANKDYKNENYEGHRAKSMMANVWLIVGFVLGIIIYSLVIVSIVKNPSNQTNSTEQESAQESESESETESELETEVETEAESEIESEPDDPSADINGPGDGSGLKDMYTYMYNGRLYRLPLKVSDFEASGYIIEDAVRKDTIVRGEEKTYLFTDENGEPMGTVTVSNREAASMKASECTIYKIVFESYYGNKPMVTFYGGTNFYCTYEEVVAILGEPSLQEKKDEMTIYTWNMDKGFQIIFENNEIKRFSIAPAIQ